MKEFKVRDKRNKGWFYLDNEYLNGLGKHLGAIGIAVYVSLCRHANNEQTCFPSQELIAEEINVSRPTVVKYLKLLEKHKVITIKVVFDKQTKRFKNNVYTLLDKSEWVYPKSHVKEVYTDSHVKLTAEPCKTDSKSHVKEVYNKDTNINNTNKKNTNTQDIILFNLFWSKYPKRVGKQTAEKEWKKLNPSSSLVEKIISHIENRKEKTDWTKEKNKYVVYPERFIRDRRWEDEIIEVEKIEVTRYN